METSPGNDSSKKGATSSSSHAFATVSTTALPASSGFSRLAFPVDSDSDDHKDDKNVGDNDACLGHALFSDLPVPKAKRRRTLLRQPSAMTTPRVRDWSCFIREALAGKRAQKGCQMRPMVVSEQRAGLKPLCFVLED